LNVATFKYSVHKLKNHTTQKALSD